MDAWVKPSRGSSGKHVASRGFTARPGNILTAYWWVCVLLGDSHQCINQRILFFLSYEPTAQSLFLLNSTFSLFLFLQTTLCSALYFLFNFLLFYQVCHSSFLSLSVLSMNFCFPCILLNSLFRSLSHLSFITQTLIYLMNMSDVQIQYYLIHTENLMVQKIVKRK